MIRTNSAEFSLESMNAVLFGGDSVHTYGFESEDLTPEETAIVEDEPVEVTDEETGTRVTVIIDEVANDSPEALATESARLFGEAAAMSMAISSAEKYVWSVEAEAAPAGEKKDNVIATNLKKFWAWVKTVFEKVKLGLVNFFRRIQIWISGDMKKYSKFYSDNKAKEGEIKSSKVELSVKLPKENFEKWAKGSQMADSRILATITTLATQLKSGSISDTSLENLKKEQQNYTVKGQSEALYGAGGATKVSAETFFGVYAFSNLAGDEEGVKAGSKSIQATIKVTAGLIAESAKRQKTDSKDDIKSVKAAASALQQAVSSVSSTNVWVVSQHISLAAVAVRFAQAALRGSKAPEAPAKKEEPAKK